MEHRKYTVNELYRHIFETIEDLRADKIDVAKAHAVKGLAQTAVNAGTLECRFIEATGGRGSGFMPEGNEPLAPRNRLRLLGD